MNPRRIACALLLLSLSACTPDGDDDDTHHANPSASDGGVADAGTLDAGSPGGPDAGARLRDVETARPLLGTTSVNNLVWDPAFRTTNDVYAFFGLTLAGSQLGLATTQVVDTPTPSLTSALVIPARSSNRALVVAPFHGGRGPFTADVWVQATTSTLELLPEDVEAAVGEAWVEKDPGVVHTLVHVPADNLTLDGKNWFHFRGEVAADLPLNALLTVQLRTRGAALTLAGPQVVPSGVLPPRPQPGVSAPRAGQRPADADDLRVRGWLQAQRARMRPAQLPAVPLLHR